MRVNKLNFVRKVIGILLVVIQEDREIILLIIFVQIVINNNRRKFKPKIRKLDSKLAEFY